MEWVNEHFKSRNTFSVKRINTWRVIADETKVSSKWQGCLTWNQQENSCYSYWFCSFSLSLFCLLLLPWHSPLLTLITENLLAYDLCPILNMQDLWGKWFFHFLSPVNSQSRIVIWTKRHLKISVEWVNREKV